MIEELLFNSDGPDEDAVVVVVLPAFGRPLVGDVHAVNVAAIRVNAMAAPPTSHRSGTSASGLNEGGRDLRVGVAVLLGRSSEVVHQRL